MRIVFIGASAVTTLTAKALLQSGHDVVIVEEDAEKIEALSEQLDCGLVHGDGSRPAVLEELGPGKDDWLLCMSNSDQDNIIASAVGQSLGFGNVLTRIEDPDFEPVCAHLGLEEIIVPDRQIAQQIADLIEGRKISELGAVIKGNLRFFHFEVTCDQAGELDRLALPADTRIVAVTRADASTLPEECPNLEEDDIVVLLTDRERVAELEERFSTRHRRPSASTD